MTPPQADPRRALLIDIFQAGLRAVQGDTLLEDHGRFDGKAFTYARGPARARLDIPRKGRVVVVGAGKAAAALGRGLESVLGGRIDLGRLVVKYGHVAPLRRIEMLEGGHPLPDAAGVAATNSVLAALKGLTADDRVFVLLTGGASALLVAPAQGVTLQDKQAVTELLMRSGANIREINTVRRRLSRVKGGGLLREIGPARSLTLMVSDIPDGDPGLIGSGPTFPDPAPAGEALAIVERLGLADLVPQAVLHRLAGAPEPMPEVGKTAHLVLADSAQALAAAARRAQRLGYAVRIVDPKMSGDTHDAARAFAKALRTAAAGREPTILLAAGETTLQVWGHGKGGRCQEFALVAARELDGGPGAALLAAGTDGTDGPTDAAGAFADVSTLVRAAGLDLDLEAALADNDSNMVLKALGDLYVTGPTGANVMDLVVGLAGPPL
jgi:glycerate 2-kinase